MYLFELCPIMWVLRRVQLGVCVFTKCFFPAQCLHCLDGIKIILLLSKFVFSVFKK